MIPAPACTGATCGEGTVLLDGACVAEGDADTDADADSDSDSDSDTDVAPQILTFNPSASSVTERDSLVFTAVVTDPQGIADVIGGTLMSPEGGTYGAFATSSEEGAYSLSLSWGQVDSAQPMSFTDSESRTFLARFYDQAGHSADAEATVAFTCSTAGYGACDGACTDLSSDAANCGTCGRACDGGLDVPTCLGGECLGFSDCIDDLATTCDAACQADGYTHCFDAEGQAGEVYSILESETCDNFSGGYYDYWAITRCTDRLDTHTAADIGYCYCAG